MACAQRACVQWVRRVCVQGGTGVSVGMCVYVRVCDYRRTSHMDWKAKKLANFPCTPRKNRNHVWTNREKACMILMFTTILNDIHHLQNDMLMFPWMFTTAVMTRLCFRGFVLHTTRNYPALEKSPRQTCGQHGGRLYLLLFWTVDFGYKSSNIKRWNIRQIFRVGNFFF